MEKEGQNLTKEQQQQMLFVMLIQQHQQICMMGLGKLKNPSTDRIERDLSAARYAIDTLAMLQEYTKDNLTSEMAEYLGHVLSTLRLNYVDEVNSPTGQDQEQEQEEEQDQEVDDADMEPG
jgi:hypothetical protein